LSAGNVSENVKDRTPGHLNSFVTIIKVLGPEGGVEMGWIVLGVIGILGGYEVSGIISVIIGLGVNAWLWIANFTIVKLSRQDKQQFVNSFINHLKRRTKLAAKQNKYPIMTSVKGNEETN